MNIHKGNVLKIGKEKYDVLNVMETIDKYDTQKNESVGEHTAIGLHKMGDTSLQTTHLLKVYHDDDQKAILFRIEQDDSSKGLERVRQRGGTFSYHDPQTISIADIKIEPAE